MGLRYKASAITLIPTAITLTTGAIGTLLTHTDLIPQTVLTPLQMGAVLGAIFGGPSFLLSILFQQSTHNNELRDEQKKQHDELRDEQKKQHDELRDEQKKQHEAVLDQQKKQHESLLKAMNIEHLIVPHDSHLPSLTQIIAKAERVTREHPLHEVLHKEMVGRKLSEDIEFYSVAAKGRIWIDSSRAHGVSVKLAQKSHRIWATSYGPQGYWRDEEWLTENAEANRRGSVQRVFITRDGNIDPFLRPAMEEQVYYEIDVRHTDPRTLKEKTQIDCDPDEIDFAIFETNNGRVLVVADLDSNGQIRGDWVVIDENEIERYMERFQRIWSVATVYKKRSAEQAQVK